MANRVLGVTKQIVTRTAKRILPAKVFIGLQQFSRCQRKERLLYLKMRMSHGFSSSRTQAPTAARSFLFVCFGNIMRSPMCEALLNRALSGQSGNGLKVMSAGLNATPGRLAHPWAIAAAEEFDVSLLHHRARLLTREMAAQADAIFAMDYQNKIQLLSRFPETENKVFMLSAYGGEIYSEEEIRDPYYMGQEGTKDCYRILQTCVKNLADSIRREKV